MGILDDMANNTKKELAKMNAKTEAIIAQKKGIQPPQ
jgi:hypothetical protein